MSLSRKWSERVGKWASNGSLLGVSSFLVALLSFVTASISLNYSIEAQRKDNEFKELSIRPHLDIREDPSHLTVFVENTGLGPAIIRETRIKFGSKCSESWDADHLHWQENYAAIFNAFLDEMETEIPKSETLFPTRTVAIISPDKFIKPGEADVIYKLNTLDNKSLEDLQKTEGTDWYTQTNDAFAKSENRLSITYKFCSVSGAFCAEAGLNAQAYCGP